MHSLIDFFIQKSIVLSTQRLMYSYDLYATFFHICINVYCKYTANITVRNYSWDLLNINILSQHKHNSSASLQHYRLLTGEYAVHMSHRRV